MKIGVSFPTTEVGNDPLIMRDFAQAAEDMGYEYLTAIDHVLQARDPAGDDFRAYYTIDNAFHEPLILFSYLAAVTTRIGFVTAILILPQRPTVLVAKQAAQLDLISGGRLQDWAVAFDRNGLLLSNLRANGPDHHSRGV